MAKNDKLKEELAESRHKETIGVRFGAFILAGLALAVAYGQWQGWLASLPIFGFIAVGFVLGIVGIKREAQKRKEIIEQLDNQKQNPMPAKSTKEPTNKDIMYEIKRTRALSRVLSLIIFFASVGVAGLILVVSNSYPLPQNSLWYGWLLFAAALGGICYALIKGSIGNK